MEANVFIRKKWFGRWGTMGCWCYWWWRITECCSLGRFHGSSLSQKREWDVEVGMAWLEILTRFFSSSLCKVQLFFEKSLCWKTCAWLEWQFLWISFFTEINFWWWEKDSLVYVEKIWFFTTTAGKQMQFLAFERSFIWPVPQWLTNYFVWSSKELHTYLIFLGAVRLMLKALLFSCLFLT